MNGFHHHPIVCVWRSFVSPVNFIMLRTRINSLQSENIAGGQHALTADESMGDYHYPSPSLSPLAKMVVIKVHQPEEQKKQQQIKQQAPIQYCLINSYDFLQRPHQKND